MSNARSISDLQQESAIEASQRFVTEIDNEDGVDLKLLIRLAKLDIDRIDNMSADQILRVIVPGLPCCLFGDMWTRFLGEVEPHIDECRWFLRGAKQATEEGLGGSFEYTP